MARSQSGSGGIVGRLRPAVFARRLVRSHRVSCLGGLLTMALIDHSAYALLPGTWFALYSLGLFASRDVIPRSTFHGHARFRSARSALPRLTAADVGARVVGHAARLRERSDRRRRIDLEGAHAVSEGREAPFSYPGLGTNLPRARPARDLHVPNRAFGRAQLHRARCCVRSFGRQSEPARACAGRTGNRDNRKAARLGKAADGLPNHQARAAAFSGLRRRARSRRA